MKKNIKMYTPLKKILENHNFNGLKLMRITSALTAVTITITMFGGCEKNNHYEDNTGYDENNQFYFDAGNSIDYSPSYEPVPNEILDLKLRIEDTQLLAFQNFVSSIQVDYKKSESYGVSESLNKYYSLNTTMGITSNEVIKNNIVDYDTLYKIVVKNNKEYKNKNPHDNYYTQLDNDILTDVVKKVVETLNYNISKNKNIDLNILDYKLKNLKIFEYSSFGYAFYSQDDIALALNVGSIPNESNEKITAFDEIIAHETNHIIQDAVIRKDSNVEQNFGMCYQFKDLKLNPLYWNWYIEAAAQSNTLVQKKIDVSDTIVYTTHVSSLNTLNSALALIKDNPNGLANLSGQNNLDTFFNYFDCKNNKDKEEIINMMVAHNLILDTYDVIYSDAFYKKVNINDEYNFKKELKASIGQTEAKIFYKNLAEKLKGKDVKLNDVFSLISVFETELSKEIWYNSIENFNYMSYFYENYSLIQNEFFELLSQKLGMNVEEISNYYINYHNTTDQTNFSNSLLNQEQNAFYKRNYRENSIHKTQTVLESSQKHVNYYK